VGWRPPPGLVNKPDEFIMGENVEDLPWVGIGRERRQDGAEMGEASRPPLLGAVATPSPAHTDGYAAWKLRTAT